MKDLNQILKQYWGFDEFRAPQDSIIHSVLENKDTIALLPTGGGKSLCYQLPALMLEGKTIVVSPLIALMQDQVSALLAKGIKAKSLNATLTYREIDIILDNFVYGDLKILYISPERITSDIFITRFAKAKISLIAVDEAHCISQWGYDFRPSYFNIHLLREVHKNVPIIALTATATPLVVKDIREKLELRNPQEFKKSFSRENLSFTVINTEDKNGDLLHVLSKLKGCGIIYVRNRKETILISKWLAGHNISSVSYHGGMEKNARDHNQTLWMRNSVQIMVSTNAFGMGIDKPDVRFVIHLDVAPSIEEYYQEAGRAGRDGKSSVAVSIIDKNNCDDAIQNLKDQFPDTEVIADIYDKLCRFYKVAYGSGQNENFDFNLSDFVIYASMPSKKIFHIMNILEKEGWVLFSDGFKEPTRIMIICHHEDLQFADILAKEKSLFITHLLRKYEGLFIDYVKIDEDKIARELDIDVSQVDRYLNILKAEAIIAVHPKKSLPQITFLLDRPEKRSFSIDKKAYNLRQKMATDRMNAMLKYLQQDEMCRQKFIVEYFGEKGVECGKCDICKGAGQSDVKTEDFVLILDHIGKINQNQLMTSKSYVALYPFNKRKMILKALKILESENKLYFDQKGYMHIRTNG
ncbi:MAG: RecQ family ATP-dependent DNA helicase [Saprospiraceae bacterium]|nr:RecQ family ATP-dependent DNA helicase [Saprospiraceae bacterium]